MLSLVAGLPAAAAPVETQDPSTEAVTARITFNGTEGSSYADTTAGPGGLTLGTDAESATLGFGSWAGSTFTNTTTAYPGDVIIGPGGVPQGVYAPAGSSLARYLPSGTVDWTSPAGPRSLINVAVLDFDGDGFLDDVAVANDQRRVNTYDQSGSQQGNSNVGGTNGINAIIAVDVSGTGAMGQLLLGHQNGRVYLLTSALAQVWRFDTPNANPVIALGVADLDGNGLLENPIAATDAGEVYVLAGTTNPPSVKWSYHAGANVTAVFGFDANASGRFTGALVGAEDAVTAFNATGGVQWNFTVSNATVTAVAPLDLNGDGKVAEAVVGLSNGTVLFLGAGGIQVGSAQPFGSGVVSLSALDLDGDGLRNDAVAANATQVSGITSAPSVPWNTTMTGSVNLVRAADMDGWGCLCDTLVGASNGVWVLDRAGAQRWNVTGASSVLDVEPAAKPSLSSNGTLVSRVVDAGNSASWGGVSVSATLPDANATVAWQARFGTGSPSNISWGPWGASTAGAAWDLSGNTSRFLQLRFNLTTANGVTSPRLRGAVVNYTLPASTGSAVTVDVVPSGAHQFTTLDALANLSAGGAVRYYYSADAGASWRAFAPPAGIDPANTTAPSIRFRVEVDVGVLSPSVLWVSATYIHNARIPAFLSPTSGRVLTGTVNLTTTAPPGILNMSFGYRLPSSNVTVPIGAGSFSPANSSWYRVWNTSSQDLANITLVAQGFDSRGFHFTASVAPIDVDNTPPTVSVVRPTVGQNVTGTLAIQAMTAPDVVSLSFDYRYGVFVLPLGNASGSAGAWTLTWDTTPIGTVENGVLQGVAVDRAGLSRVVQVNAVTVDNNAPWVRVDSPVAPSTIAGQPRVNLTASPDAVAVTVYLNGALGGNATLVSSTANASFWTVSALNTTSISYDNAATLVANVTDRVGLTGTNSSGPFTVDNTLPMATLISPSTGGTYTGTLHLAAVAPPQVTRVAFYYQDDADPFPTLIRQLQDADRNPSTGYFEFDWDTRSPVKVEFTGAIVLFAYSNLNASPPLRFDLTVDNSAPYIDFLSPSVSETRIVGEYTIRAITSVDAVSVSLSYINQSNGQQTQVGNLVRLSPSDWRFVWNVTGLYMPSVTLRLEASDFVGFQSAVQHTDLVVGSGPGDQPPRIVGTILDLSLREDFGVYEMPMSNLIVDEDPGNVTVFVDGVNSSIITLRNNGSRGLEPIYFLSVPNANTAGQRVPLTLRVVDRWGQSASAAFQLMVLPVNDPPVWRNAPSRIFVHNDAVYQFDFAPYIYDPENRTEGQRLTLSASDAANVSSGPGLSLLFNYPASFIGHSVNITLSVTDGDPDAPAAFTTLEVVVTEDWMPESVAPLPAVTLEEDVPKRDLYNLNDYFIDRDDDPIFYTRGDTNLTISIDSDGNLSVTALPPNWFGMQTVLIGASDPTGAFSEVPAVFIVTPVNDPPTWDLPAKLDFHNVSVHFDVDFTIAYGPFVQDVDNPLTDLRVETSDRAHAFAAPGSPLTLVLRYYESYNGTVQSISVWVTDGSANSTVLKLNVTVSDNYPPSIIRPLPLEIVINEGETREDALNLFDYFHDRDGVLFFASGNVNIDVKISDETGSVALSSPSDWSGTERIVLRAIDDRGAFQDAVMLVTVLAVDDPPRFSTFPVYVFDAGHSYTIELAAFATDPDTPLSDLTFSASSIYPNASIVVVGGKLKVIYPEEKSAPSTDALRVCVSDGGPQPTCRIIAVTVNHATVDEFDFLRFFIFMGAVSVIAIVGARHFFEFKVRRDATVEDIFLVYEDGILIKHYSKQVRKFADDDVVTSMLSAIQSFAADSFEDTANWELREIAFQGRKILIERARKFQIFVIFDGDSNEDLKKAVRKAAESIAEAYEEPLRDWDGDPSHFDGAEVHFAKLLAMQQAFVPEGVTADELRRVPLMPGSVFVSETGDFAPLLEQYRDDLKGVAAVRLRPQGDAGVPLEGLEAEETQLVEIPPPSGVPADDEMPASGLEVALKALGEAVGEATVAVRNRFPLVLFEGFDFVVDRYGFVFSKKFADQLKRMAASEGYILFIALTPTALSPNQMEAIERDAIVLRGQASGQPAPRT